MATTEEKAARKAEREKLEADAHQVRDERRRARGAHMLAHGVYPKPDPSEKEQKRIRKASDDAASKAYASRAAELRKARAEREEGRVAVVDEVSVERAAKLAAHRKKTLATLAERRARTAERKARRETSDD